MVKWIPKIQSLCVCEDLTQNGGHENIVIQRHENDSYENSSCKLFIIVIIFNL